MLFPMLQLRSQKLREQMKVARRLLGKMEVNQVAVYSIGLRYIMTNVLSGKRRNQNDERDNDIR